MRYLFPSILLPLVWTTIFLQNTLAARILVIHALYSGSPLLTWRTAGEYFAQNGHHVHYLRWKDSHHHSPLPHENMTETVLTVNNKDGRFSYLTKEKEAGFDVRHQTLDEILSSIHICIFSTDPFRPSSPGGNVLHSNILREYENILHVLLHL